MSADLGRNTVCVAGVLPGGRGLITQMLGLLGEQFEIREIDCLNGVAVPSMTRTGPFIVCIDEPVEVARFVRTEGFVPWLRFVDRIVALTGGLERTVLFCADTIADPLAQLRRLAVVTGRGEYEPGGAVQACLRKLLHGKGPPAASGRAPLPLGVEVVYSVLRSAAEPRELELAGAFARRGATEYSELHGLERELARARDELGESTKRQRVERRWLEREFSQLREAVSTAQVNADAPAVAPADSNGFAAAKRKEYEQLVERLRKTVEATVPPGSAVAVVSRGDSDLLRLEGRSGWHFPQLEGGVYAGHHPADSATAIAHLEHVRSRGAGYLVFPSTAGWWFDHYPELKRHLEEQHELVCNDPATCFIYRLRGPVAAELGESVSPETRGARAVAEQVRELAKRLLPPDAIVAVVMGGNSGDLGFGIGNMTASELRLGDAGPRADRRPSATTEAISELETARAQGVQYLVIPGNVAPLLLEHRELAEHIDGRYRLVTRQRHVGSIYDLGERDRPAPRSRRPREARRPVLG